MAGNFEAGTFVEFLILNNEANIKLGKNSTPQKTHNRQQKVLLQQGQTHANFKPDSIKPAAHKVSNDSIFLKKTKRKGRSKEIWLVKLFDTNHYKLIDIK